MSNKFSREKPLSEASFKPFQKLTYLTKISSDKIIGFNPLPPVGKKLLKALFELSFFLAVGSIIIIFLKRAQLPKIIPLFFSKPWGKEQLGKTEYLFLLPIISLLVLFINCPISLFLLKRGDKFLASAIASLSFLFSFLGTISVIKIILLV